MLRLLLTLSIVSGCRLGFDELDRDTPVQPGDPPDGQPITVIDGLPRMNMRSGAWWGNLDDDSNHQLWAEITDATPGTDLVKPFTLHWVCRMPKTAAASTLVLDTAMVQLDSTNLAIIDVPTVDTTYTYTIDPALYPPGWHEVRVRCKGTETAGSEIGQVTSVTAGFPIQLRGGTATYENHSGTDYVDTHGWYSRGVGYVYTTILNIGELAYPQSGAVKLDLDARASGDTTLDYLGVFVDGRLVSELLAPEVTGTPARTITFDTTDIPRGLHRLAVHARGLETAASERPGQELVSRVEVMFEVFN